MLEPEAELYVLECATIAPRLRSGETMYSYLYTVAHCPFYDVIEIRSSGYRPGAALTPVAAVVALSALGGAALVTRVPRTQLRDWLLCRWRVTFEEEFWAHWLATPAAVVPGAATWYQAPAAPGRSTSGSKPWRLE